MTHKVVSADFDWQQIAEQAKTLREQGVPERIVEFVESLPEIFDPSSDRARVLIVVSMIDKALEDLLRWHFMRTPGVEPDDCNFLLTKRPLPPIGNLGIKARTAFVLGLIEREILDGIHYASDIRNDCAHKPKPPKITEQTGVHLFKKMQVHDWRESLVQTLINAITFEYPTQAQNNAARESIANTMRHFLKGVPENTGFLVGCLMIWLKLLEPIHRSEKTSSK
jgi:DNA-binding MltR family transcriptional regulator